MKTLKIENFKILGVNEYGTEHTEFYVNSEKLSCGFNKNSINKQTYRVLLQNGDLSNFTNRELAIAMGKHCPKNLIYAIDDMLKKNKIDISFIDYGIVSSTYIGKDGNLYANIRRPMNHGRVLHCTYKVPSGIELTQHADINIDSNFELMVSTESPYKKQLKTFKRKMTTTKIFSN